MINYTFKFLKYEAQNNIICNVIDSTNDNRHKEWKEAFKIFIIH